MHQRSIFTAHSWQILSAILLMGVATAGCLGGSHYVSNSLDSRERTHPEALLRAPELPQIVVEIDYVEGYAPSNLAIEALQETIEKVTGKQISEIAVDEPHASPTGPRSDEDIAQFAESVFNRGSEEPFVWKGHAVLHIVYLDGNRDEGSARGVYLSTHAGTVVLFPDTWQGQFPVLSVPSGPDGLLENQVERHVLIHELGHAFGLVGCGIPMVRDRAHAEGPPCHSINEQSVMFVGFHELDEDPAWWLSRELDGPVWTFDDDDMMDIRSYQKG